MNSTSTASPTARGVAGSHAIVIRRRGHQAGERLALERGHHQPVGGEHGEGVEPEDLGGVEAVEPVGLDLAGVEIDVAPGVVGAVVGSWDCGR